MLIFNFKLGSANGELRPCRAVPAGRRLHNSSYNQRNNFCFMSQQQQEQEQEQR